MYLNMESMEGFQGGSVVSHLPIPEMGVQPLDPLEEKMATHSNILAWEMLWTEELGKLQSWGCKESDMTE